MTEQTQGTPPANPLQQIGAGLRTLFGGLMQPATGTPALAAPEAAPKTAKLVYEGERHTISSDTYPEGVSIREAFEGSAGSLGLDTERDMTFRSGTSVVDGNAKVAWGQTYEAQVAKSTKG